jgi:hypothetical protein
MAKEELVQGNTYLIKYGSGSTILHVTVLMVTDKAYRFKYETGSISWVERSEFNRDYNVVENITDFILKEKIKESDIPVKEVTYSTEYETCPICHGTGEVPNVQTTAAFVTCPLCQGNKRVVKRTEAKV